MLERDFQANVTTLATTLGWLIHHDRGDYRECIGGDAGFPDLVLAKNGRVIFLELKAKGNKPTEAQQRWLEALPDSYLVYPDDMQWIAELLGPNGVEHA